MVMNWVVDNMSIMMNEVFNDVVEINELIRKSVFEMF